VRICAIDTDTRSPGYAIFDGVKCIEHGIIPLKRGNRIRDVFAKWMLDLVSRSDILVIEDQFIPKKKPNVAKSMLYLAAARGKLELFFELEGKRVVRLMAFKWQSDVLWTTARKNKPWMNREEAERRTKMVAEEIVGGGVTNADVASAICIGSYFARLYQVHGDLALDIATQSKKKTKVSATKRGQTRGGKKR